jgi:PAT family acetyl-CoA transporter-like MFS transporter 1
MIVVAPNDCIDFISLEQEQTTVTKTNEDNIKQTNEDNDYCNKDNSRQNITNIIFLIYLYVLHGIPYGLIFSLSGLILNYSKRIEITYYSVFFESLSLLFFLKLIWSPLVDTVGIKRIGRRKTWTFFTLILIGILLICVANFADYVVNPKVNYNRARISYRNLKIFF